MDYFRRLFTFRSSLGRSERGFIRIYFASELLVLLKMKHGCGTRTTRSRGHGFGQASQTSATRHHGSITLLNSFILHSALCILHCFKASQIPTTRRYGSFSLLNSFTVHCALCIVHCFKASQTSATRHHGSITLLNSFIVHCALCIVHCFRRRVNA